MRGPRKVHGTICMGASYIEPDEVERAKVSETRKMKEAGELIRGVAIVILVLLVLFVAVPFVLAAVGIVVGFLVTLAVFLIKAAVVVAVIYLIIVGIRAVLR